MVKDYEVHEITPGFPGHKDKPSISKEVSKDMAKQNRILVTRAGGFIGHHVVKRLKANGQWVRPA
jgi:FlaA1/EpsC-like NDP-sugar epimerase